MALVEEPVGEVRFALEQGGVAEQAQRHVEQGRRALARWRTARAET